MGKNEDPQELCTARASFDRTKGGKGQCDGDLTPLEVDVDSCMSTSD